MREAIADSSEGIEGLSVVTQSDLEADDDMPMDDVEIEIDEEEQQTLTPAKAKAASGKTR